LHPPKCLALRIGGSEWGGKLVRIFAAEEAMPSIFVPTDQETAEGIVRPYGLR